MATIDDLALPVHTERLLLRRVGPDDLEALWAYRHLPEVQRWTGGDLGRDEWAERMLSRRHELLHLLAELGGRVVGDVFAEVRDGWGQRSVRERAAGTEAEIGWTFDPAAGGQGYATEAVRALLDLCFDGLALRRVTAQAFLANERSWRLMERVGMRREAVARADSLHAELGWLDGVTYAVLAAER